MIADRRRVKGGGETTCNFLKVANIDEEFFYFELKLHASQLVTQTATAPLRGAKLTTNRLPLDNRVKNRSYWRGGAGEGEWVVGVLGGVGGW